MNIILGDRSTGKTYKLLSLLQDDAKNGISTTLVCYSEKSADVHKRIALRDFDMEINCISLENLREVEVSDGTRFYFDDLDMVLHYLFPKIWSNTRGFSFSLSDLGVEDKVTLLRR